MPTIDQLPPAVSVSDSDEFVVSQSDIARSATRAQVLSGVQAALALPSNNLLGRMSPGIGSPENISVGANLTIANGALNAPPAFVIAGLGFGGAPSAADLVPLAQGGQNAAVSYASFMGGLTALNGISGSGLTAQPTGGLSVRTLGDIFADALSIESFGAVGDGMTDDTPAFQAALASGHPLRLDGRVYVVNGPLIISAPTAIAGISGASVVTRTKMTSSSSWITVSAATLTVTGVAFDAASMAGGDMPAVSLSATCVAAQFVGCGFANAVGPLNGSGLSCSTSAGASHNLVGCSFSGNALHGLYVSGSGSLTISGSQANNNGGAGIRADAGVATAVQSNRCTANGVGISVGAWTTGAGPTQGTPFTISGNSCAGNSAWGIAASGSESVLAENVLSGNGNATAGGGVLARLVDSRLACNIVTGGCYGIDARGCSGSLVDGNHVSGTNTGLSLGGSQGLAVRSNVMVSNEWAILVSAIEPNLSFRPTGPITVSENWISFTGAQGGGITVADAAQGLAITGNDINGSGSATVDQAIWLHTDAAVIKSNRWNNQARFKVDAGQVAGLEALVVPDVADEVLVTSAPNAIQSILTSHQADTIGQIAFIKVTQGGAGYTQAQVTITGSGFGAAATAIVNAGEVIWVVLTNPGSGYGLVGSVASVTVTGDGTGAAATAYVGIPVTEGRQIRLNCNAQLQLALAGTAPPQQSWTGYPSTIPAFGCVDLEGTFGNWRAVSFPPVDYLAPTGDGGAVLRSVGAGNLTLRPASGGALHLASANEATGCTSTVGRGSPVGVISAPPGSDFRNLNGGPGSTFWVKQQNSDATGWAAIG